MAEPSGIMEKPLIDPLSWLSPSPKPQAYYEVIKQKFAEERNLRLNYRPEGTAQYTSDLTDGLAHYEEDPYGGAIIPREPINDQGGMPVHRRRLFRPADLCPAAQMWSAEHPYCGTGSRCWRHLVLEPLPRRGV